MADPSQDYINYICSLYGSSYDDRIENTAPPTAGGEDRTPGEDWVPGMTANHKSLQSFKRELEQLGIKLSTSKIKKILITGGLWTTSTSRHIQTLFNSYTSSVEGGGDGLTEAAAVKRIAEELEISFVSVSVNLPYMDVVYNLPEPSANAKRCRRLKERRRDGSTLANSTSDDENADECVDVTSADDENIDERTDENTVWLWNKIIASEGEPFATSGRGSRPGISFTYIMGREPR